MIFSFFKVGFILLVGAETILSAVPSISKRVVHRIIIVDLCFGDFCENVVTMSP